VTVREAVANFRGHREPRFRIIERKRFWFMLSGAFIVLSLIGLAVRGLNFSIDFKGGSLLKYPCPNCASGKVSADDVSTLLSTYGLSEAEVQVVNGNQLTVRTRTLTSLGNRPGTILTLPNTSRATADDVRAGLAEYGRSQADVSVTPSRIRVHTQPLSKSVQGIVLSFDNSKANLKSSDLRTILVAAGYPGAQVNLYGTRAVIQFNALPVHPKAAPVPSTSAAAPNPTPTPSEQSRAQLIASIAGRAGLTPADVSVRNLSTVTESDVIAALAQTAGTTPTGVHVREVSGQEQQRVLNALASQAGTNPAQINREDVGPTWGSQISNKAIKGLIIFLVLVTLYIALRFEWKMALAAQTALLHDLVITAGIYALVGRIVTPATVIAILTILGYSLYDTVVIFDKVKENTESTTMVQRDTYSGVVNHSLNQVFMRSVNTSLVVLLPILSLLLFGGETLKDFAFALFVGVASGTYSSIFVASPMLALLKEREPKYAQIRQRVLSRAARPQLRPVPAGDGDGAGAEPTAAPEPTRAAAAPGGQPRPAPSARSGSGSKRKRKTTAAQRRRR
jgi:preprotein translocase subunit SecF